MADAHKNFAYSTIVGTSQGDTNNPGTGTTLTVQAGEGKKFPPVPFNATVWPTAVQPTSTNAEIVRVTDIDVDTFTIARTQEGSSSHSIIVGDQIAATVTAKTFTDAEAPLTYWAPVHIAGTNQTGWQTLASNITGAFQTNSLFVFPVTVPPNLQFNQILIGNSLSNSTGTVSAVYSYYSRFGIYSMNGNTVLSLISSNSFSIAETQSSRSLTWNYPTTTATSGYGTGSQFAGAAVTGTQQQQSYIWGSRIVGLQFGGNMTLTGGQYYIGLLSLRTTGNATRNTYGISHAGIQGQPIISVNMVSGSIVPLGIAASAWSANNTNQTQWWGRHILGFVTATSLTNFGGSVVPSTIALSAIGTTGGAGSTVTILPTVTFVST